MIINHFRLCKRCGTLLGRDELACPCDFEIVGFAAKLLRETRGRLEYEPCPCGAENWRVDPPRVVCGGCGRAGRVL